MQKQTFRPGRRLGFTAILLVLIAGCTSQSMMQDQPYRTDVIVSSQTNQTSKANQDKGGVRETERKRAPVSIAPAAAQLIALAGSSRQSGALDQSRRQLEQAQRISPKAPQVYAALAEHYASVKEWGRSEQFALKGVSLAGNDRQLRQQLWVLVAKAREARGDARGAALAWQNAEIKG
ncbi:MAG: hypothetical protein H6999_01925 [Hahellaceae bacterium]|nr:hypothetical protein [Hahellaceae bacterium]MCP5168508.1 hypothetical protein [Hahellaceae bacterium]